LELLNEEKILFLKLGLEFKEMWRRKRNIKKNSIFKAIKEKRENCLVLLVPVIYSLGKKS